MKRLFWVLYDGINSLVIIAGAVYFTKWLIADAGVSDAVVAAVTSSATILFVLIGPRFGASLRTAKSAFRQLLITTVFVGVFATALGLPGLRTAPSTVLIAVSVGAFFFLNLVYQLSLVAYNAYLPVLVERQAIERVSGMGEAAGQLGSVAGLLVSLALLAWVGGWLSRSTVRIFFILGPVVLLLAVAAVIAMQAKAGVMPDESPKTGPVSTLRILASRSHRQGQFFPLIVVVFLYNNAFATLQIFASSYLSITAGWDEKKIGVGILLTLLGAAAGGFTASAVRHRMSAGLQLLAGTFVFGCGVLALALARGNGVLLGSLLASGLGFGFLAAVSRSCIVLLVSDLPTGLKFGVYGAVTRTAAIVGPLVWAGTIAASSTLGEATARRIALVGLDLLIWASFGVVLLSSLRTAGRVRTMVQVPMH